MLEIRPSVRRAWPHVRYRLEKAASRRRTEGTKRLVRKQVRRTDSPAVIAGLARHPHSRAALRDEVATLVAAHPSSAPSRLLDNPGLLGAFVGAAHLLLDDDAARTANGWMSSLPGDVGLAAAVMQSLGVQWRPGTEVDEADRLFTRALRPVRHRLVITEKLREPDRLALLLPDATDVTVFGVADFTGKASFDDYASWPGMGHVSVEHLRTRISRFSPEYIALHEATAALAGSVTTAVTDLGAPVQPDDRPDLELAVADFLLFETLRLAALETLLDDADFDQIVIAVDDQDPSSGYLQMLAAMGRLRQDSRVEVVSISDSDEARANFSRVLATLDRAPATGPAATRDAGPLDWSEVDTAATELSSRLGEFDPAHTRPRALLVTSPNPAYDRAVGDYALLLQERYDLRVLNVGNVARGLRRSLRKRVEEDEMPTIVRMTPNRVDPTPLSRALAEVLRRRLPAPAEGRRPGFDATALAWQVVQTQMLQLCYVTVVPHLSAQSAMHTWFARLADQNSLPDVVVLVPQRMVVVSSAAGVAREFGVPSVAVEPHFQDANYSRYAKVRADYYGVVSEYFRQRAPEGFGIEPERVVTVGTPRLVAPAEYDAPAAQANARADLAQETGLRLADDVVVVFFAQPSSWTQMARVWGTVLEACTRAGVRLLLKPHPEESPSRVRRYLTAEGAADVVALEGGAEEAVAVADLVLTTYSASAIDALLQRTPVICVGDGDEDYPVDIATIADAPLTRSVDELVGLIEGFRSDPGVLQDRARRLLEREPQFTEGPAPRLHALLERAIESGTAGIRPADTLPDSRVLDGPHPTFSV